MIGVLGGTQRFSGGNESRRVHGFSDHYTGRTRPGGTDGQRHVLGVRGPAIVASVRAPPE